MNRWRSTSDLTTCSVAAY